MTIQQSLQLFDIVNRNFKTESDARLFVTEIDALISSSFKDEATDLPTRQDLDIVKNELLKEIAAINKETAQLRIDLVKEIAQSRADFMKESTQTKSDLMKEIAQFKIEISKELAITNKEIIILKGDIAKDNAILRADLSKQIESSKIELIKWTFSFWITIVMLIVGAFFLRK